MMTTRNTAIVAPPAMLAVSNITRCREAVEENVQFLFTTLLNTFGRGIKHDTPIIW